MNKKATVVITCLVALGVALGLGIYAGKKNAEPAKPVAQRGNAMLDEVNTNTTGYKNQLSELDTALAKIQRDAFTAGQQEVCDKTQPEAALQKANNFYTSIGLSPEQFAPGTELGNEIDALKKVVVYNCYHGAADRTNGGYAAEMKDKVLVLNDAKAKADTPREKAGVMGMGLAIDAYDAGFNAR